ncbi:PDGLE domain-containing protein [Nocardia asteroides]|uniref:PDGLE domain-containing protein n=1 Tax=Nocardia asteroides TaxID=1824 RepID=UPI001E33A6A0|nr:PDGLE domain-containing protein [Nocardia asteroides]UGT65219.1 PDGLE domain-containing protein [Nocardia asteroides]
MYLLRSTSAPRVSLNAFLFGFAAAAVLVAGALSYLASSQPDGLDATTQRGCTVVAEQLEGECIAQRAEDHGLAGSPLADYTIGGDSTLTGLAGILGAAATFAALFALVRVLLAARPSRSRAG